jgi:class 3 adenylate cyclase/CHASE2 domain-containing sensor protein
MRWRDAAVAVVAALATASVTLHPLFARLDGLSIDALFWLRHQIYGPQYAPDSSPAVVVALDEETYKRPPFLGLPKVMWTPAFSVVVEALLDAGVVVIGQDLVLPTSVEQYISGFDRDYLRTLRKGAREGRIVLSRMQFQNNIIRPAPAQRFAVDHGENIRMINLHVDVDGVVRRIPLLFQVARADGAMASEPSMAVELAARASGVRPEREAAGVVSLGGYTIPGSSANAMLLNFDSGPQAIPTFSLADLHACVESGRDDFFREHFAGKIVLFGTVLDVEDRKVTSKRLLSARDIDGQGARCVHPMLHPDAGEPLVRNSIPGVFILATAVNNLLRGDALHEFAAPTHWTIGFAIALLMAFTAMLLGPTWTACAFGLGALAWMFGATAVFEAGYVLPLIDPVIAGGLALSVMLAYRLAVTDRIERHIRKAFGQILAPALVERMVQTRQLPAQGGELRDITVWISDLQNYTTISELLPPPKLVDFLNAVYTVVSDTIDEHDGYVAQFAGDAVVAAFGVPLDDPDHAQHGVQAAMACVERVAALQDQLDLPRGFTLRIRVGVGSGALLVGYIGSKRRLDYAVVGDTINLSSRLEGVNKVYGSSILVDQATRDLCGDSLAFREVDIVRVKGRDAPVRIFEPFGPPAALDPAVRHRLERFDEGLQAYRAREFAAAADLFEALAEADPVARAYAARCRDLQREPPPADWDGVNTLSEK